MNPNIEAMALAGMAKMAAQEAAARPIDRHWQRSDASPTPTKEAAAVGTTTAEMSGQL